MFSSRFPIIPIIIFWLIAPLAQPTMQAQESPPASNSSQQSAKTPEDPAKPIKDLLAPSIAFLASSKDEFANGEPGAAHVTTALIVRQDGLLLASYYFIRGAKHVQVRLPNGDVFNRVELVSYDEPRDLAVLKINAANLTPAKVAPVNNVLPGDKIWVLSTFWGNEIRALACSFKDLVPAEAATANGKGFSLLEIASGDWLASGQIAVDSEGRVLGLVIDSIYRHRSFAAPLTDIAELTAKQGATPLGSGVGLQLSLERARERASAGAQSPTLSAADLGEIARKAHTIRLESHNTLIPTEPVAKKLMDSPDFSATGLVLVKDDYSSDLTITFDRPVLTWDFTYTIRRPPDASDARQRKGHSLGRCASSARPSRANHQTSQVVSRGAAEAEY